MRGLYVLVVLVVLPEEALSRGKKEPKAKQMPRHLLAAVKLKKEEAAGEDQRSLSQRRLIASEARDVDITGKREA